MATDCATVSPSTQPHSPRFVDKRSDIIPLGSRCCGTGANGAGSFRPPLGSTKNAPPSRPHQRGTGRRVYILQRRISAWKTNRRYTKMLTDGMPEHACNWGAGARRAGVRSRPRRIAAAKEMSRSATGSCWIERRCRVVDMRRRRRVAVIAESCSPIISPSTSATSLPDCPWESLEPGDEDGLAMRRNIGFKLPDRPARASTRGPSRPNASRPPRHRGRDPPRARSL